MSGSSPSNPLESLITVLEELAGLCEIYIDAIDLYNRRVCADPEPRDGKVIDKIEKIYRDLWDIRDTEKGTSPADLVTKIDRDYLTCETRKRLVEYHAFYKMCYAEPFLETLATYDKIKNSLFPSEALGAGASAAPSDSVGTLETETPKTVEATASTALAFRSETTASAEATPVALVASAFGAGTAVHLVVPVIVPVAEEKPGFCCCQ